MPAVLTAARVELHRRAGRELNKLLLQEQDAGGRRPRGGRPRRAHARRWPTAGRTVAWEGDDAWRRRSV